MNWLSWYLICRLISSHNCFLNSCVTVKKLSKNWNLRSIECLLQHQCCLHDICWFKVKVIFHQSSSFCKIFFVFMFNSTGCQWVFTEKVIVMENNFQKQKLHGKSTDNASPKFAWDFVVLRLCRFINSPFS